MAILRRYWYWTGSSAFQAQREPVATLIRLNHLHTTSISQNNSSRDINTATVFESRHVNSAALEEGLTKYYCNRNPRSLELLGVAEKPKGHWTKSHRVDFYHRLLVDKSSRHFSAFVHHNNGNRVVEASTKEFCISRHLYKTSDCSAAYNIGRVIAHRCKSAGLNRVMWEHKWDRNHAKIRAFVSGLKKEGLILNEPRPRKQLPTPGELPR